MICFANVCLDVCSFRIGDKGERKGKGKAGKNAKKNNEHRKMNIMEHGPLKLLAPIISQNVSTSLP